MLGMLIRLGNICREREKELKFQIFNFSSEVKNKKDKINVKMLFLCKST